jgi:hypothetical protein
MLGGGLANGFKSHVTIEGSTFYSNKAYSGGAIATLFGNGSVLIANSTISANHSGETGGGLSTSADTVTISNSTITKNSTSTGSAGGVSSDGMLYIRNSILAENINGSGAAPDCSGEVNSDGFNLIGNTAGCSFNSSSGDLVGTPSNPVAPLLGPLTNNGGPTFTHALLPNSPAIDAGNPLPPGSGVNACEVTDQRGAPRQGRGVCDIGAFESTASGDTSTGTENNSGDIGNPFAGETGTSEAKKGIADRPRNPFFGETRTSQADTKTPHTPEHQPQPPETSERASRDGRNGEDRSKEEASALSRLLEFLGLNEKTTNSGWSSVESNHYVDEWLDVNNINTAGGEAIPRALTLGASVTIVAGVVNLFVRSMNLLGMFFSFPLWSRIDPIPVLLLANKEIKRRKKQAGKEAELENKGGHLGQVLDD